METDLYAYVLVSTPIVEAMITQQFVPAEDAANGANPATVPWAAGTFTAGQERHRVETGRVYRRIVAGTDAAGELPENYPERWQDRRATNRRAMYDGEAATATVAAVNAPTVKLRPGPFNGLYVAGIVNALSATVTVRQTPGGVVSYGPTVVTLEASMPGDWWEYFNMPFRPAADFVVSGIESFVDPEIEITLTGTSPPSVGILQVGDLRPLGITEDDADAMPVDYSYVAINADGVNEIRDGRKATDLAFRFYGPQSDADGIVQTLRDLQGRPSPWFANIEFGYTGLRTFGLGKGQIKYKDNQYVVSMNVKGLT